VVTRFRIPCAPGSSTERQADNCHDPWFQVNRPPRPLPDRTRNHPPSWAGGGYAMPDKTQVTVKEMVAPTVVRVLTFLLWLLRVMTVSVTVTWTS